MFARILAFDVKLERKEDFVKTFKNQVLPIFKKQSGFVEILPFFPERAQEKVYGISLWSTKLDAERYARETYSKVYDILKPFLTTPVEVNYYTLETTLCQHFVETMIA